MELSLFSRDVIAMATGIALAHDMFDATLLLGVCDKIVPGLLIGALSFGHLPAVLVPAGLAWNYRCSAEMSLQWRPELRSLMTCLTRRYCWEYAIKSCQAY